MSIDELLARLDGVRARGTGRFSAKCPAHADRSPSLSITAGNRGLLVHCWAGCRLSEICTALHLQPKDLFFDIDPDPARRHAAAQERARRQRMQARQTEQDGAVIDALKAATYFIESRSGLDILEWSDQRLHEELEAVADAYRLLESEAMNE